jgi:DNA-binding MarR family transcriptional regulator
MGGGGEGAALAALFAEVEALGRRLRAVEEAAHGRGTGTAAERGILGALAAAAPCTIAALARSRPVTRQHVQAVVARLESEGLVARTPNPAHRRSPLFSPTPFGEELLRAIALREARVLGGIRTGVPAGRLLRAAGVLRAVRRRLEPGTSPSNQVTPERRGRPQLNN